MRIIMDFRQSIWDFVTHKNFAVLLLSFVLVVFVMNGCSSKKYFQSDTKLTIKFDSKLPSKIIHSSRNGAVLKNNDVLDNKGEVLLTIKPSQKFLTKSGEYYLLQEGCKDLIIIDSKQESMQNIPFEKCVASASLKGNLIALVSTENTIMLVDINNKKEIFSQKLSPVIAINSLNVPPLFEKNMVIFPTLDGRILIYNTSTKNIIKDILIQSDKFFNNIIYLYAHENLIIAATPKRISTILGNNKTFNYDGNFNDMLVHNNRLFVLSSDGKVIELDNTLKVLREVNLEYAKFASIVIKDNKLYTLDRHKHLIEVDLQSFEPTIYKVSLPAKKYIFYTNDSIFYDGVYKRF